jgi:hypothetical protein
MIESFFRDLDATRVKYLLISGQASVFFMWSVARKLPAL